MERREVRPLALAASVLGNPPVEELVDAAVTAGFDALSVWPAAGYGSHPRHRQAIEDAGLYVLDVDALVVWVGPDDPGGPYLEEAEPGAVLDAADALGARAVNVLLVAAGRRPIGETAATLAAVAEAVGQRGLATTVEFARGTALPDLATAVEVVSATGRSDVSITLDTWHLHWGDGSPADVTEARALVGTVQLSDAPAERPVHLRHASRFHREVPGTGAIALEEVLGAAGVGTASGPPVVIEAFNRRLLAEHGPAGFARLLANATRRLRPAGGLR